MARWKLMTAHYLHTVALNEWEYQETDRNTGRPVRRKFIIPRLLNPLDPNDWTSRWGNRDNSEGEIIVCLPSKGESSDHEFLGDPTPDMIPMDDEAREISATFEDKWRYKPDTDTPGNFSQSIVDKFRADIADAQSKPAEIPGLSDLVAAITAQTAQIGALTSTANPSLRR